MSAPLHIRTFGEKVAAMNAGAGKEIKLTAPEARALHHAIYLLMDENVRLNAIGEEEIVIDMDAGNDSLPKPRDNDTLGHESALGHDHKESYKWPGDMP